ncbi:MAG: SPOR domain-containing protein [Moorella sp. (in: firmicutes)]
MWTERLWRVQVGAFAEKENAETLAKKLRSEGYDVYIMQLNTICSQIDPDAG